MASKTNDSPAVAGETVQRRVGVPASLVDVGYRVKDVLTYSSAYLVFIAMVEVLTVHVVLSLPLNPAPIVVGLVTFSVYAGDRIADAEVDAISSPERSAFVVRHRRLLSVLTAGAYGIAVAISLTGGPLALAITLLPGGFWILYASEWFPTLGTYFKRLKQILVVNSTIVAAAWAIAVVGLPLAFADAAVTPLAGVVFVYFLVDTFVNTEIPNVRDIAADQADGVSTIPVVLGVRRTRHVLYGLDLWLVAFVGLSLAFGPLTAAVAGAILVGLGYALVLAWFVGRSAVPGRLAIAGEAKHLVVFALLLAFTSGI
ncbi:4-hydroxybenzoate polyprenyltransferase [Halorubrum sp. CBA1125]|uniref:UbiA family prenyltransferase n=1 Tax=Halorubrum sp. CBA1125 TaxID=2668072 RepID=UPI0012E6F880|nr:UbiA family prenyltransferase [Halorubrum sp. CBA1125]MUW14506.1 4-hydroxybenzoate polyprenyltransferase [Halorubrum sp. CBA1125]